MENAEAQLTSLRDRVNTLETYFKIALVVGGIFGIGAGWGINALSSAKSQISDLQKSIITLNKTAGDISGRFAEIDQASAAKLTDITNKLDVNAKAAVANAAKAELASFQAQIDEQNRTIKSIKEEAAQALSNRIAQINTGQIKVIEEGFTNSGSGICPAGSFVAAVNYLRESVQGQPVVSRLISVCRNLN